MDNMLYCIQEVGKPIYTPPGKEHDRMKKHTYTRLWRMGTKIILSLLALLLCFSGCVQKPDDGKPGNSQPTETLDGDGTNDVFGSNNYDRSKLYSSIDGIHYGSLPSFSEKFHEDSRVVMVAKVKIVSFEGVIKDQSYSIFQVDRYKQFTKLSLEAVRCLFTRVYR